MQKADKKPNSMPLWGRWALGYGALLVFAAALVYFWRLAFQLPQQPGLALTLTASVAGVLTVLYALWYFLFRFCKNTLCLQATICVFVLGLLFCFFTAPLQVPDESRHFLRAYAVSEGRFDYDYSRGYPNDVNLLLQYFEREPGMNHQVHFAGGQLAPAYFMQYKEAVHSGAQSTFAEREPVQFMVVPYLLQGAGMAFARLFGFTALGQMYAGRIANLLFYAAICYLIFKNCNKYRGVFYALALLPLSLFMAASCSTDSMMLALCYLAISYFCKEEIVTRDVIIFGLAVAFATALKPNNFVLAAVILLIPEARWKTKTKPWLTMFVTVGAAIVLFTGLSFVNGAKMFNYGDLDRGVDNKGDFVGQLKFILSNPLAFIPKMILAFYEEDGFLFNLGRLGRLDMSIPLVGGLSVLSLSASSALGIQQKEDTKSTGAIALFLAAFFYAGAVIMGIYLAESDVGSIRVTGLQPRYFLPVLLLLFMLGSILLGKAVRPRLADHSTMVRTERITLYIAMGVALFSAILLFQNYFIGQWIQKITGQYKMINLFGWMIV